VSTSNPTQILTDKEARKEIIDTIAHNSAMMQEMMTALMSNPNSMVMLQQNQEMTRMLENQSGMMNTMKYNPGTMQNMMSHMMEMSQGDSTMMADMCKTMMDDPAMMKQMQQMMGKYNGKHKMGDMDDNSEKK
jgi:hypothetical protein